MGATLLILNQTVPAQRRKHELSAAALGPIAPVGDDGIYGCGIAALVLVEHHGALYGLQERDRWVAGASLLVTLAGGWALGWVVHETKPSDRRDYCQGLGPNFLSAAVLTPGR